MTSDDYEKLGMFYLGKLWDASANRIKPDPLLYDAKDLTTHAVIVGMTGSGKTGLAVAMLEEAAIDGVPSIVIDPKGDMGNLLLTFPELRPDDFRPWIDEEEARRAGVTPEALAGSTAERWRKGLADWNQDPSRITRLRSAVQATIYTPGARAGMPLAMLRSFAAPPPAVRAEPDLLREQVGGAVAAVLGLIGIQADPLRNRETILLATLLERAWSQGRDLDLGALVQEVSSPPFDRIGVFDLEAFFPAKDRTELALALNGLLASPGFSTWTQGESLDVGRLLFTPEGRPRMSVISIAHLSEAERMFCVTVLLNEIVAWMRTQSGTSSLRAILYMDEIFGYFPPTAMPSSKRPMLTLLKQARAYGLGVVLATQNPVDLDYKGLANAGTWFIGRLQAERDKLRVLDGLEGALAATGRGFDRAELDQLMSGLGNRVFLMNNVHDGEPSLFQSRWALSYLRGPMTRDQIRQLVQPPVQPAAPEPVASGPTSAAPVGEPSASQPSAAESSLEERRPLLAADAAELFLTPRTESVAQNGEGLVYRPAAFASARVRYTSARLGIDRLDPVALIAPLGAEAGESPDWGSAEPLGSEGASLEKQPFGAAKFARVPGAALRKSEHDRWRKAFVEHVVQACPIVLLKCPALGETSKPGETEAVFRQRLAQRVREDRDQRVEALRQRFAPKVAAIQERIRKGEERVEAERAQSDRQHLDLAVEAGASILGAILGRRGAGLGRARTAIRSAGRSVKQRGDVARAEAQLIADRERLRVLEADLETAFRKLPDAAGEASRQPLDRVEVRPRKTDVSLANVALLWIPWRLDGNGAWLRV